MVGLSWSDCVIISCGDLWTRIFGYRIYLPTVLKGVNLSYEKKNIIKVAGFLIILGFVLWKINSVVVQPATVGTNSRYRAFYKEEPENTWDGVLLGSSVVDRGWAAPLAWHEHGIALYAMSSDSLPLPFVTNIIEEIRKKQDVKFLL